LRKTGKGVPRGPPEWGELLYEPQWAKERRFKDSSDFLMGIAVAILSAAFVLLSVHTIIVERPPLQISLILLVGIAVMAFGINITLGQECRQMPFRVYEAGCTDYNVPMVQGFWRRETLIPWERVRSIDLKAYSDMGTAPSHMDVSYEGPAGEGSLYLMGEVDDPLAVMIAFHRTVPDKLDERAYDYLGVEDDGPVVDFSKSGRRTARTPNWFLVSMIGIDVFVAVLFGAMFVPEAIADPTPRTVGVVLAIVCGTILFLTIWIARKARSAVHHTIGYRVQLVGDRLEYPVELIASSLLRVRPFVPLSDVAQVRKGLAASFFIHVSLITTRDSDRFTSDIDIYQALRDREGWVRDGVVLRNTLQEGTPGGRIVELGMWRMVALFSVMTLIALLSGCVAFLLMDLGYSAPMSGEEARTIFMVGAIIVMPILVFLLIAMKSRETRLVKSLFVSDKGISVRGAKNGLSWIDMDEIDSCRIVKTWWQHEIHIETDRGTLGLPMSAYEKLTEGGVSVEDPIGVIPRKLEEATPPQPPSTPP